MKILFISANPEPSSLLGLEQEFHELKHEVGRFSMQLADGSFTPVEAVVEEMVPNQKLHQRAGFPGVLTADHQWLLVETPAGTRVIQHEEYRGVGVLFYDPSYVQVLYAEGLTALKARLEGYQ